MECPLQAIKQKCSNVATDNRSHWPLKHSLDLSNYFFDLVGCRKNVFRKIFLMLLMSIWNVCCKQSSRNARMSQQTAVSIDFPSTHLNFQIIFSVSLDVGRTNLVVRKVFRSLLMSVWNVRCKQSSWNARRMTSPVTSYGDLITVPIYLVYLILSMLSHFPSTFRTFISEKCSNLMYFIFCKK